MRPVNTSRRIFLAALAAMGAASFPTAAADGPAGEVKVMSYNVRYGTAGDGANHWEKRKDFLAETIRTANPDLLGTQETLDFQRDYLAAALPTHAVLSAGREDGKEKGETTAIFWRKDQFEQVDGGHFWLSETPGVAGSRGWDASLPRMATWVRLADKAKRGKPVLWVNTHFDHVGKVARLASAKLIRDRIGALGKGCSIIVTGDFNAGEGSDPYAAMFGARENEESPLVDSLRVAHPAREEKEGTTTPFLSAPNKGNRIDWIGVSRDWQVIAAGIEHPDRKGRTASDHFPVTATLAR